MLKPVFGSVDTKPPGREILPDQGGGSRHRLLSQGGKPCARCRHQRHLRDPNLSADRELVLGESRAHLQAPCRRAAHSRDQGWQVATNSMHNPLVFTAQSAHPRGASIALWQNRSLEIESFAFPYLCRRDTRVQPHMQDMSIVT